MIWGMTGMWRPMTKAERAAHRAQRRRAAQERAHRAHERAAREAAKRQASWDRMKDDTARRYS